MTANKEVKRFYIFNDNQIKNLKKTFNTNNKTVFENNISTILNDRQLTQNGKILMLNNYLSRLRSKIKNLKYYDIFVKERGIIENNPYQNDDIEILNKEEIKTSENFNMTPVKEEKKIYSYPEEIFTSEFSTQKKSKNLKKINFETPERSIHNEEINDTVYQTPSNIYANDVNEIDLSAEKRKIVDEIMSESQLDEKNFDIKKYKFSPHRKNARFIKVLDEGQNSYFFINSPASKKSKKIETPQRSLRATTSENKVNFNDFWKSYSQARLSSKKQ
ncbi:hypothetical protein PVAND_007421 [Polypedilum vanderplanki]|uniref:Uncharacterized protein n=1 Tax=Polypedilum vanderplanki TaxID=319348 RepID=A0A9J6C690_POLVA|nr:hypothetical protein PVAND_007421 [Polypedilum vanderplanki]